MIAAASKLREFAQLDGVRLAIMHAEHAEATARLENHRRQCVDLAVQLHSAATGGERAGLRSA